MKHTLFLTAITLLLSIASHAQNRCADDILGMYYVNHQGDQSRIMVVQDEDGTYKAQVTWVLDSLDKHGNLRLDVKNPDKSLRSIPCNRCTVVYGLKFNSSKARWDNGKVYDPTRGIHVNGTMWFENDSTVMLKGSFMGISETVKWQKL